MIAVNDIGEMRGRVAEGQATARDAVVLLAFVDHLAWRSEAAAGQMLIVCRHCGVLRGDSHASLCPAGMVD